MSGYEPTVWDIVERCNGRIKRGETGTPGSLLWAMHKAEMVFKTALDNKLIHASDHVPPIRLHMIKAIRDAHKDGELSAQEEHYKQGYKEGWEACLDKRLEELIK